MPIRFRCSYCDKLLGIAQRKAGQEVTCPKCKGRMRVPAAQAVPSVASAKVERDPQPTLNIHVSNPSPSGNRNAREHDVPSKLFENDDFDRLLASGTLPGRNGEGAVHIPSTSTVEKLAKESSAKDRELFAIDLDAEPDARFDNDSDDDGVSGENKNWRLLVATAVVFFVLGLAAGYLVRR